MVVRLMRAFYTAVPHRSTRRGHLPACRVQKTHLPATPPRRECVQLAHLLLRREHRCPRERPPGAQAVRFGHRACTRRHRDGSPPGQTHVRRAPRRPAYPGEERQPQQSWDNLSQRHTPPLLSGALTRDLPVSYHYGPCPPVHGATSEDSLYKHVI